MKMSAWRACSRAADLVGSSSANRPVEAGLWGRLAACGPIGNRSIRAQSRLRVPAMKVCRAATETVVGNTRAAPRFVPWA